MKKPNNESSLYYEGEDEETQKHRNKLPESTRYDKETIYCAVYPKTEFRFFPFREVIEFKCQKELNSIEF